jgi:adenylosuccinate synthase
MPCTVVVGGQYGSEGKGKIVTLEARRKASPWVVRCGGPNSGHTTVLNGSELVLRQLPAAVGQSDAMLLLSAGCIVDEDVLIREIHECNLPPQRVIVDPRAVLVEDADRTEESELSGRIGSTASGTGAALRRRMSRKPDVRLAKDSDRLPEYCRMQSVAPLLHHHLDRDGDVIVEGTQGFGLSLLHGPHYPFVTSRDTTAAAFAMEVGLSPRQIDEIILVVRTFPIRVAGHSGPLADEITWEEIQEISKAPTVFQEYTSVTKRLRRVGRFDFSAIEAACRYNRPTALAIMGLDRLDYRNCGAKNAAELSPKSLQFIQSLETRTGVQVRWIGTGFKTDDAICLVRPMKCPNPC